MKKPLLYHSLRGLFVLSIAFPLFGKLTQNEQFLSAFTALGFPVYFSYILAIAYSLGLVAIFQSRFLRLREWAYAGFTFALIGAFLSHVFSGEAISGVAALLSLLFLLSSYFLSHQMTTPQQSFVAST